MKLEQENQFIPSNESMTRLFKQYDLELLEYKAATSGIENTTLIVTTKSGNYVARIYRKGKKSFKAIYLELDFVHHLFSHGIKVPDVLVNNSGLPVTTFKHGDNNWQAIIMDFVTGEHAVDYSYKLLNNMAVVQARMHNLSGQYKPLNNSYSRLSELKEDYFIKQINRSNLHNTVLEDFLHRAEAYKVVLDKRLPEGFCHLDYDKENILTDNDDIVAVLDFDDLGWSPFVVCLAYTLWHIHWESGHIAAQKYLANYEAERVLSVEERACIKSIMLFRHYMISAIKILNSHTSETDIKRYIAIEAELAA